MTRAGIPLGAWVALQPGAAVAASSNPVTLATENLQDYWLVGGTARSTLNDNLLAASGSAAIDTLSLGAGYGSARSIFVQITGSSGISAGQIIYEGSNDNTTFTALPWVDQANPAQLTTVAFSIVASGNRYFGAPITFRYIRVRVSTAFTGGTVSAIAKLSPAPFPAEAITVTPGNTANTTAWLVSLPTPTAATLTTANTTNATSVKASAGTLYSVILTNPIATAAYLKLYNKASAPTVGTDVPVAVFAVPASSDYVREFGVLGQRFSTGIAYAVTAAAADSDTAAAVAGVHVLMAYT